LGNLARIRIMMKVLAQCAFRCGLLLLFAGLCLRAHAQMADGPDKELFVKTCSKCHEIERVLSKRQDRDGWQETVAKMQGYGLLATDADLKSIIGYLAANLPAETISKLNINTAARIDFESALSVKRSVAAAIIEYRDKNGGFKSIEELKKVPGVDASLVDEKKNALTF
jgi:competence protein ComEA